jgi:hypothetical protein
VQLSLSISKELHQRLRLVCIESDATLMDFVIGALRDKLAKTRGRSES